MFDIELDEGNPSMRKLKLPYNKTGISVNANLAHASCDTYCFIVDPYIAADEFLTANDLPAGYLDEVRREMTTLVTESVIVNDPVMVLLLQVAEFIKKNADVDTTFSGGGIGDPFTGRQNCQSERDDCYVDIGGGRYVPGQGSAAGMGQQGEDPFTGT